MRKKLFGKLLSVALSATMAVTSAVPAYAADSLALSETKADADAVEETEEVAEDVTNASESETESEEKAENGEGEEVEPEEVQDEDAPKEEEATENVTNVIPEEEVVSEETTTLEEASEEEAELQATKDVTITFGYTATPHLAFYDPQKVDAEIFGNDAKITSPNNTIQWDSSKEYFEFYVKPEKGYVLDTTKNIVDISYTLDSNGAVSAIKNAGYTISFDDEDTTAKTAESATVKILSAYLIDYAAGEKAAIDDKANHSAVLNVKNVTDAAKADTYFIKAENLNVAATNAKLKATYDASLKITIDDDRSNPITGVKAYLNYGTDDEELLPESVTTNSGTTNYYAYKEYRSDGTTAIDSTDTKHAFGLVKKIEIEAGGVNAGYKDKLTFVGQTDSYSISQASGNAASTGVTLSFAELSANTAITTSSNVGYVDKTRKIAYWTVTLPSTGSKITRVDADSTGIVDNNTATKLYPGEKFVVNGPIESIVATWAYKYELLNMYRYAVTPETTTSDIEVDYIDSNGESQKEDSTTTVPVAGSIVELVEDNESTTGVNEYDVTHTLAEGGKVNLGLALKQNRNKYNRSNDTLYSNTIYPAYEDGWTVTWKAYDGNTAVSSRPLTTETAKTEARNTQTVLDPDQLAKGILVPKANTAAQTVWVYAEYTKDGVTYGDETKGCYFTVGTTAAYHLSAARLPKSLEVGETITTKHNYEADSTTTKIDDDYTAFVLTKGSLQIGDSTNTANAGTFEYIYDNTVISVEQNTEGVRDEVVITGLKEGKTTLNARFTDTNGVSVTSTDGVEIEVKKAAVEIQYVNVDGTINTDDLEAKVGSRTDNNIIFTARLTSGDKDYVTGAWDANAVTRSGNAIFGTPTDGVVSVDAITTKPADYTDSHIRQLQETQGDDVGSYDLTLVFTYQDSAGKDHIYTRTDTVNTYNTLVLKANNATQPYLAKEAKATNVASETKNHNKVSITNASGEVQTDSEGNYIDYTFKVFEKDLNSNKNATTGLYDGFKIDISDYAAAYNGDDVSLSFAGWAYPLSVNTSTGVVSPVAPNGVGSNSSNASTVKSDDAYAMIEYGYNVDARSDKTPTIVYPLFLDEAVSLIDTNVTSGKIVISNEDQAETGRYYSANSQNVEVYVTPVTSDAKITAETKNSNTGGDQAFSMADDDAGTNAEAEVYPFGAVTPGTNDKVRKYEFSILTLDEKVGENTITFTAEGSDVTKSLDILVYGLYEKNNSKRYMTSDGSDLTNSAVTLNTVLDVTTDSSGNRKSATFFFGKDGYEIIKKGPAYDQNGNYVLLSGNASGKMSVVKTDGMHANGDSDGNAYYTIDSVIQTGFFETKDGKKYVSSKDGVFTTYAMTVEAGTPGKIEVDGTVYVIKADNTAEPDHEHKWTLVGFEWAKDWQSATVSFKCEVGDEPAGPFDATVTPEVATGYTKYTASYTFNEVPYSETKYVNDKGEEFVPHDGAHEWVDTWTWAEDYSYATVTLTCSKGEYPETRTATVTDIKTETKGTLTIYTASYTLDGKDFTSSKSVKAGKETDVIVSDETGLVIDGLDDEFVYDGTKKQFKNLKVYWNDSILVEGTDYKLTYANNVNAGDNSATVTIKGMGQYEANVSEVIEFSIEKADFEEWVYPKDGKYTTTLLTGTKVAAPAMMFKGKTLNKNLYTVTLEDGAEIALGQKAAKAGTYEATVAPSALGAVNFSGSTTIDFQVADAANTVLADKLTITPSVTAISKSDGVITPAKVTYTVKYKGVTLSAEDFASMFDAEDEFYYAGTFNPSVKANEGAKIGDYNVVGSKNVKVTVKGTNLSTVKSAFAPLDKKSVPYKGEAWEYEDILEYLGIEGFSPLEYGTDYYVNVTNNLKKGTMKVKFTGTGIYQGSVTKNVPIRALTEDEYTISINGENYDKSATDLITVPYTAGGAVIKDLKVYVLDGFMLREGVDYTVSYKNNKTVNGTATLTIKGKKNYGNGVVNFKVGANDGAESAVYSLPTEVASAAKADGKKAPAIYDAVTGKKLTAGKDFTYSYATTVEDNILKVTIKNGSLGTYDFGESGIELDGYHVFQTAITNKLVSVKGTYYYTGTAITLGEEDFSGLKLGEDFEVVGYKNNIKAGTAKVTVKGIGKYGKTATLSFKINKATVKSN